MAKKNGKASRIVTNESKIVLVEQGLNLGEDRLDFLNDFPRVRPALDGYVEICATRLAIAGVADANILAESEYLALPQGTGFLTRYYGSEYEASLVDQVRLEARHFDASNVSKAIAPAATMITRLYRQSGSLNQAQRSRLLSMLSSLSLMILLFTLKMRGSPGPNYQMMRQRLQATYEHEPLFKDILGLVIDFDKKAEYLLMLRDNRSHQGVEQQIDFLVDAAHHIKKLIIDACVHLEEVLLNRQYAQPDGAGEKHLLDLAVSLESATSNNQQRITAALEAAEEIVDPQGAFDRKLAKGKNNASASNEPKRVRVNAEEGDADDLEEVAEEERRGRV